MDHNPDSEAYTTEFEILDGQNHTISDDEVIISASKSFPLFNPLTVSIPVSKERYNLKKEELLEEIENHFRNIIEKTMAHNEAVKN